MTGSRREIVELWQRANEALQATGTLLEAGFADFAAFYAASALLIADGKTFRSHRGVLALIHRDYVNPGRLPAAIGQILSTLSDLRNIGDYGGVAHVSPEQAQRARNEAQHFLEAVRFLLPEEIVEADSTHGTTPEAEEPE